MLAEQLIDLPNDYLDPIIAIPTWSETVPQLTARLDQSRDYPSRSTSRISFVRQKRRTRVHSLAHPSIQSVHAARLRFKVSWNALPISPGRPPYNGAGVPCLMALVPARVNHSSLAPPTGDKGPEPRSPAVSRAARSITIAALDWQHLRDRSKDRHRQ